MPDTEKRVSLWCLFTSVLFNDVNCPVRTESRYGAIRSIRACFDSDMRVEYSLLVLVVAVYTITDTFIRYLWSNLWAGELDVQLLPGVLHPHEGMSIPLNYIWRVGLYLPCSLKNPDNFRVILRISRVIKTSPTNKLGRCNGSTRLKNIGLLINFLVKCEKYSVSKPFCTFLARFFFDGS